MAESPEQLHINFQEAFNRHDLEAIVALYEPDAVLTGSDETFRGTDAIRGAYRRYLKARPSIALETVVVSRVGELAMLQGKWTLRAMGNNGEEVIREGRNAETARLQPDGRWLFVIDNPLSP